MRKLIVLGLMLLLFTGCYDYVEINEMAIVYGVAVDLKDEEFHVTFEILNTKNKDDMGQEEKVYYARGTGFSLSEAFTNTAFEIAKTPYLAHLKTVIISEEVAKNKLEDLLDFMLRDNHIRNIFYLVMARDYKAEEILTSINTNNPISSNAISDLIEHKNLKNNMASAMNFEKFMTTLVDPRQDVYLSSVTLEDSIIKLGSLGIFDDFKFTHYLTDEESALLNLITGEAEEYHFKINCPNSQDTIIFSTNKKSKAKMEVEDSKVSLKLEPELRLVENHCDLDFRTVETYELLEEKASDYFKTEMEKLTTTLKDKDSDLLGIKRLYYQKYKKDIELKDFMFEYSVKTIINQNGLIFEVER